MTILLPGTSLQHIAQFADEPTLDSTACSSHKMKAMTNAVRRARVGALAGVPGRVSNEVHPTRLELAGMGNPSPNMTNVMRVLQEDADAPAPPGPIMATARAHAALQQVQRLAQPYGGLAQRVHHAADIELDGFEVGECNAQQQTHGFGIRTYRRFPGRKYEGNFANGLRHGMGFETFRGGAAYEGMFANDVRQGKGTLVNANGSRYVGDFHNGEKHGHGTLYSADGRKTSEGQFEQGMRHGPGTIFNKNGSKAYEGHFQRGARHGQGTLFYADGTKQYEGMLQQGTLHGHGTYRLPDGSHYTGEFRNGEPHGTFTCIDAQGRCVMKVADDAFRAQFQRDRRADGAAA